MRRGRDKVRGGEREGEGGRWIERGGRGGGRGGRRGGGRGMERKRG